MVSGAKRPQTFLRKEVAMTTINRTIKVQWRNPYATEGLVAMFDGIWNSPGAHHRDAPSAWTDLVGKGAAIAPVGTKMTFEDKYVKGIFIATIPGWRKIKLAGEWTVEIRAENVLSNYVAIADVCSAHTNSALIRESKALILSLYGGEQHRNHSAIYSRTMASITVSGGRWKVYGANGATFTGQAGTGDVGDDRLAFGRHIISDYRNGILRINAIRIYFRALTDAEIAANSIVDDQRFG